MVPAKFTSLFASWFQKLRYFFFNCRPFCIVQKEKEGLSGILFQLCGFRDKLTWIPCIFLSLLLTQELASIPSDHCAEDFTVGHSLRGTRHKTRTDSVDEGRQKARTSAHPGLKDRSICTALMVDCGGPCLPGTGTREATHQRCGCPQGCLQIKIQHICGHIPHIQACL